MQSTQITSKVDPSSSFPHWETEQGMGKMIPSCSELFSPMSPIFQVEFLFLCWCLFFFFFQCRNKTFQSIFEFVCNFLITTWRRLERIMAPRFTLTQDFKFLIPTCFTNDFAKQPSLPFSFIFLSCSINYFRTRCPGGCSAM